MVSLPCFLPSALAFKSQLLPHAEQSLRTQPGVCWPGSLAFPESASQRLRPPRRLAFLASASLHLLFSLPGRLWPQLARAGYSAPSGPQRKRLRSQPDAVSDPLQLPSAPGSLGHIPVLCRLYRIYHPKRFDSLTCSIFILDCYLPAGREAPREQGPYPSDGGVCDRMQH